MAGMVTRRLLATIQGALIYALTRWRIFRRDPQRASVRQIAALGAVAAVTLTGAAKCSGGGSQVQVPGGPEVKVHEQQQPEMRRQCPVCSGKDRVFGTRCRWCKGFGRVRL